MSSWLEGTNACLGKMEASQEKFRSIKKTEHCHWVQGVKARHMLTALQGCVSNILHQDPKERCARTPLGHLRKDLGTSTWSYRTAQLKTRTQITKPLQKSASATEQLTHHAFLTLQEGHVRSRAGRAFVDGLRERSTEWQLLLCS
jgi:hypothetical protein